MNEKLNIVRFIIVFFVGLMMGLFVDVMFYKSPIEDVIIIVTVGIIIGRFIELTLTSLYRGETESQRARYIQIAVRWLLWCGVTYWGLWGFYNPGANNYAQNMTQIPASIFLLTFGAYRLARLGVHPVMAFLYGCCGVLLVMPRFEGMFKYGLWFQPQASSRIVIQWFAFSMLLGAISAGVSVSFVRRKHQQHPANTWEEIIEEIMMGAKICCFLVGARLGGGLVTGNFEFFLFALSYVVLFI